MGQVQEFASSLGKETKWHGDHNENSIQVVLNAGLLSMIYESGNIRSVFAGNTEIVRMIYSALRDKEWLTIMPVISEEKIEMLPDAFTISYSARYRSGEIDFLASYNIFGKSDNSLIFSLEGEAMQTFEKNRIGFCVLHPVEENAGRRCEIVHSNGQSENMVFPEFISPHQPFIDIASMRWKISDIGSTIDFYGDIFECEDQRNWTDASYKTYSTPLSHPFPVKILKGEKISQKIVLKVEGGFKTEKADNEKIKIVINNKKTFPVPLIGIGRSTRPEPLSEGESQIIRKLGFDHYRVDVYLFKTDWKILTERSVNEAGKLKYPLELALFFDDNATDQASEFIDWISAVKPEIALIIVYHKSYQSTPDLLTDSIIPLLKKALPCIRYGCGTNANFAQLNRNQPQSVHNDFVCYPIQPQEHASDNLTLVENLKAQRYTVESAIQFSNNKKIWISPVNIQRRFNANIDSYEQPSFSVGLPLQVDSRLMSLFGACWTAGSLKYLSEAGIEGVTFYETVGERGIIQGDFPSRWPDRFYSFEGMIFPVYFVFEFILKHKKSNVVASTSTHPLKVESVVISYGNQLKIILFNFTSVRQQVIIEGCTGLFTIRQLNVETFADAVTDIKWIEMSNQTTVSPGEYLLLDPYSVSLIDGWHNI
jgi:hypothetical protein